jgi:putative sporulation protein YyaC
MVQRIINDEAIQRLRNAEYVDILCIGTPKVIGDAVGPLIGTMLIDMQLPEYINVIGSLREPVHRQNYYTRIEDIREDALVVGIDACIGDNYPLISVNNSPLRAGAAITDELDVIGDISIKCYTARNVKLLYYCDLNDIYSAAKTTVHIIKHALQI